MSTITTREGGVNRFYQPFETGAPVGLALGLTMVAGGPFALKRYRMLAAGVGAGLPLIAKILGHWIDPKKKSESNMAEAALNFCALGVGIAVSLQRSVGRSFALAAVGSGALEFARGWFLQKASVVESTEGALVAAAFCSVIGAGFYLIPARASARVVQKGLHAEGWERVFRDFEERGNLAFALALQRRVGAPTQRWIYEEEKHIMEGMRQRSFAFRELLFRHDSSISGDALRNVQTSGKSYSVFLQQENIRLAETTKFFSLFHNLPRGNRYNSRHSAFSHELNNELMRLQSLEVLGESGVGDKTPFWNEAVASVARMGNLFRFYGEKPRMKSGLEILAQEQTFLGRGRFVHDVPFFFMFSREKEFDAMIVIREMTRNALRVAESRNVLRPQVQCVRTRGGIAVIDNALGFESTGRTAEQGLSGTGLQLLHDLTELNGWHIHWETVNTAIGKGTRFVLLLKPERGVLGTAAAAAG